ncbi:MAG: alkaline phosphatase family protein [Planctomycetota bacterium]|nr:alkaline phosphatase family protein [Planctomycetota bacterium]
MNLSSVSRRRWTWTIAASVLVLGCLRGGGRARAEDGAAKAPEGTPQNVILISWDGLDRPVVKELLDKDKLPNLAALLKEGSFQTIEVKGHTTVTKPGHAEMLTGLDTKETGVYSNAKYEPIPEGYTIFERMQKFLGGKDKIHTFMVTGKLAHVGGRGPDEIKAGGAKGGKAGKKPGKRARDLPDGADNVPEAERAGPEKGEPFFLTRKALDVFDAAQRDAGEVGPLCLKYLERYKEPRFLAFLHFSDPDHAGHKHGSGSDEYREAAQDCDKWLGKIVKWVKKENLYDKTLIYVMTDHGFDPDAHTHNHAPHSWLATNDKLVTHGGTIADVPATILARFGVDVEKLEPKLIGKPLTGPAPKGEKADEPRKEDDGKGAGKRKNKGGRKGLDKNAPAPKPAPEGATL